MRKILIGGLGVAGLLATVLALAGSPATAQTVVVFTTDTEPGAYTMSWSTRGGCDPTRPSADTTLATDGASGSISRTVNPPAGVANSAAVSDTDNADPADTIPNNQGTAVQFSVSTAEHCTYDWTASFTSNLPGSDGIRCAVGGDGSGETANRDGTFTRDETDGVVTLAVADAVCNTIAKIRVDVARPTNDDGTPSQPHSGAILNTAFTIGAEQNTANNAPTNDECATVGGETEVSDPADTPGNSDDDIVSGEMTVVRTPLSNGGHTCVYNVGVVVPAGFEASSRNSEGGRVASYGLGSKVVADDGDVSAGGRDDDDLADTIDATVADCGQTVIRTDTDGNLGTTNDQTSGVVGGAGSPCVTADLVVAEQNIYILQNVVGDSGGGTARYSLTENKDCALPDDLPQNLESQERRWHRHDGERDGRGVA